MVYYTLSLFGCFVFVLYKRLLSLSPEKDLVTNEESEPTFTLNDSATFFHDYGPGVGVSKSMLS